MGEWSDPEDWGRGGYGQILRIGGRGGYGQILRIGGGAWSDPEDWGRGMVRS